MNEGHRDAIRSTAADRRGRRWVLALAAAVAAFAPAVAATERIERSVALLLGNEAGYQEARYAADGSVRVHFEFNDRGRGPALDAVYRVGADGTLQSAEVKGVAYFKTAVDERFARDAEGVRWKNGSEDETRPPDTAGHYLSLESTPEEGALLARALLARPDRRLALLPVGEVRLETMAELPLRGDGVRNRATLYALRGLDLTPSYLWLDQDGRFLASWSEWFALVREEYRDALPRLAERQRTVEREATRARAAALTHRVERPLVIDDVRVLDVDALAVRSGQKVIVDGGRIRAVGDRAAVPTPDGAEVWDGGDRFLMPGLWDMHVHLTGDSDGVLHLAGGVTTVRDLANDNDQLAARIAEIEGGRDIGPRVIRAGFIDGRGPYAGPTKVFADTEEEARAAVARFAGGDYAQIKIYSSIKPELVPTLIHEAHRHGLRLSGHVPDGMSAREFVEAGADELQHINFLFLNFLADDTVDTRTPQRFTAVAARGTEVDLGGTAMRAFIALLRARGTVVDPTAVTFEGMFLDRPGRMGPTHFATLDRFPATWQRSIRAATGGLPVTPHTDVAHRESFRRMLDLIGLLHRSGVTLVAGTDTFVGFALARELELYVQAGIPPAEALRIATLGAARVMKRDGDYGRVAPGYVADLALIEGDPTRLITDLRRVHRVLRGDRWYDPAALYAAVTMKP